MRDRNKTYSKLVYNLVYFSLICFVVRALVMEIFFSDMKQYLEISDPEIVTDYIFKVISESYQLKGAGVPWV